MIYFYWLGWALFIQERFLLSRYCFQEIHRDVLFQLDAGEKKKEWTCLENVLIAYSLKGMILNLRGIYSTAQFEIEQESTLNRSLEKWPSSSQVYSPQAAVRVDKMNEWLWQVPFTVM